mmetsp:Transcript_33190/g.86791  ORF Transcript_33190/g.86791 Transcript_33190/m.86791 type:complete len:1028 (-) Transcript_33190:173-3256(-)
MNRGGAAFAQTRCARAAAYRAGRLSGAVQAVPWRGRQGGGSMVPFAARMILAVSFSKYHGAMASAEPPRAASRLYNVDETPATVHNYQRDRRQSSGGGEPIRTPSADEGPGGSPCSFSFVEVLPHGCCRDASGGRGSFTVATAESVADCEALCTVSTAGCFGVEVTLEGDTSVRCELHHSDGDFDHTALCSPLTRCYARECLSDPPTTAPTAAPSTEPTGTSSNRSSGSPTVAPTTTPTQVPTSHPTPPSPLQEVRGPRSLRVTFAGLELSALSLVGRLQLKEATVAMLAASLGLQPAAVQSVSLYAGSVIVDVCFADAVGTSMAALASAVTGVSGESVAAELPDGSALATSTLTVAHAEVSAGCGGLAASTTTSAGSPLPDGSGPTETTAGGAGDGSDTAPAVGLTPAAVAGVAVGVLLLCVGGCVSSRRGRARGAMAKRHTSLIIVDAITASGASEPTQPAACAPEGGIRAHLGIAPSGSRVDSGGLWAHYCRAVAFDHVRRGTTLLSLDDTAIEQLFGVLQVAPAVDPRQWRPLRTRALGLLRRPVSIHARGGIEDAVWLVEGAMADVLVEEAIDVLSLTSWAASTRRPSLHTSPRYATVAVDSPCYAEVDYEQAFHFGHRPLAAAGGHAPGAQPYATAGAAVQSPESLVYDRMDTLGTQCAAGTKATATGVYQIRRNGDEARRSTAVPLYTHGSDSDSDSAELLFFFGEPHAPTLRLKPAADLRRAASFDEPVYSEPTQVPWDHAAGLPRPVHSIAAFHDTTAAHSSVGGAPLGASRQRGRPAEPPSATASEWHLPGMVTIEVDASVAVNGVGANPEDEDPLAALYAMATAPDPVHPTEDPGSGSGKLRPWAGGSEGALSDDYETICCTHRGSAPKVHAPHALLSSTDVYDAFLDGPPHSPPGNAGPRAVVPFRLLGVSATAPPRLASSDSLYDTIADDATRPVIAAETSVRSSAHSEGSGEPEGGAATGAAAVAPAQRRRQTAARPMWGGGVPRRGQPSKIGRRGAANDGAGPTCRRLGPLP